MIKMEEGIWFEDDEGDMAGKDNVLRRSLMIQAEYTLGYKRQIRKRPVHLGLCD
jgi:hypothetical protein